LGTLAAGILVVGVDGVGWRKSDGFESATLRL